MMRDKQEHASVSVVTQKVWKFFSRKVIQILGLNLESISDGCTFSHDVLGAF